MVPLSSCGKADTSGHGVDPDEPKTETIADRLDEGKPFGIRAVLVGSIDAVNVGGERFYTMQGMASDGEYLYFALLAQKTAGMTEEERPGIVVKYSTDPFKLVTYSKQSELLGHANDMAYDFVAGNMIIATMTENDAILRFDTSGMKVVKEDKIPNFGAKVWAISSQSNGNFLVFKGSTLCHTDNHFTKLRTFNRTDSTEEYSGQGLGMDDKYAYVPMSSNPRGHNTIVVYDFLKKKYVTTLRIDDDDEIESIVWHKGKCYANFITFNEAGKITGAKLCEIVPEN